MNYSNNLVLFISGSPRSGSTLLYNSICSSELFNKGLTENHFIPNLIKLLKNQIQRNKVENFMHFEDDKNTINFYGNIIKIYLDKLYSRYKVNNLCLKSIMFSLEAPFILRVLPHAHMIFIVRDPKDIIASMLNVSKKQINLGLKPNYPRDMKALCSFINSHYNFLINNENINNFSNISFVKYEDLILNTLDKLNSVFEFLKLDYEFKNLETLWDRAPTFLDPHNNPYHSDLWNQKPSSSKIGSYTAELTKDEINYINNSCRKLIDKFNY